MYFILAGGYWGQSRHFGRQVDADSDNQMVDYAVQIEGLPEEMIQPEGWKEKRVWVCEACGGRVVPEWEMEQRQGCFMHKPTMSKKDVVPDYRRDVFEDYQPKKMSWLRPCFRVWMNNEQGQERWRQIWRYVERNYPANKIVPMPIAIGNKRELTIEEENCPLIDLRTEEKKLDTDGAVLEKVTCGEPGCGRFFEEKDKNKAINKLRVHYMGAHNKNMTTHELATF